MPELIACSTATRTRETLAQLKVTIPTTLSRRLYLASPGDLHALLKETDDAVTHVLVIGHNPGLHGLVAMLTDRYKHPADEELLTLKFPTSTYVSLTVPCARWAALAPHTGLLDTLAIGSQL